MESYRDLEVWQRAMDLVEAIYGLVKCFPPEERFALGDQLRRAAVSIPSNIAEGYARNADADFRRFLLIAAGSTAETQTQLLIAERVGLLTRAQTSAALTLTDRIGRMLHRFAEKLGAGVARPANRKSCAPVGTTEGVGLPQRI